MPAPKRGRALFFLGGYRLPGDCETKRWNVPEFVEELLYGLLDRVRTQGNIGAVIVVRLSSELYLNAF
jgi:hypothetical protein